MLKWAPIADDGTFLLDEFEKLLTQAHAHRRDHAHVERARHRGADQGGDAARARARHPGAGRRRQAAVHMPVDVQDLDCDFYAFTGHKTYGPTGIGVLYAKRKHLDAMPPYQGGGDMIESVHTDAHHLRRAAAQVRGRHAADRAGDRARRRARLHDAGRPRPHRRARGRAEGLRARPAAASSTGSRSTGKPRTRAPSSPSASTGFTRTTSRPSSTGRAWPCGPATTARSR